MRISDRLKDPTPTISFEFYPPTSEMGFWDLYRTIESLKSLSPDYVSVTHGAGGGTRQKTLELVTRIKGDIGLEGMAHLTCVGSTEAQIGETVDQLLAGGVENILALRGDPPTGQTSFTAEDGGFLHANELVSFIRHRSDVCIGAACYPETHPEASSPQEDLDHLKRKVDAGVDFLITQLFFDNADYWRFRDRAVSAGIEVPMIAGVMPILSVKQVKRFTTMCGARIPAELLRRIEAVEDDTEAVRHIGMYHTTQQCLDLIGGGAAGIHFYTLNRSTATRAIFQFIRTGM
jgi:methylenetetrahydrofolate reductase (NADPH)